MAIYSLTLGWEHMSEYNGMKTTLCHRCACAVFTVGGGQMKQVRTIGGQQRVSSKVCPEAARGQNHGAKLLDVEQLMATKQLWIMLNHGHIISTTGDNKKLS